MRRFVEGILGLLIFLVIISLLIVLIPSILFLIFILAVVGLVIGTIIRIIFGNPIVRMFRKKRKKGQKEPRIVDVKYKVK
jgi:preprotein translocase subunit SecF